ncbi:MAG: Dabb family protein [Clostridia bacterium]
MVKHIVMWKYKAELGSDEREALFEKLQESAKGMNGKIKGLISASLLKNINPSEPHDICLYCEFENYTDVENYQVDPIHIGFKNIITGNVTDRVCVDCLCE